MDLDPSAGWDFAAAIFGKATTPVRQLPAKVSRVDPDGTVWLSMPGSDGLVPASVTADVKPDDSVTVEWWGNAYHVTGNRTSPSIGTRAAAALRRATAAAAKVAGEAQNIADAIGQHFWADDNGLHVSTEPDNATGGRNILVNSLGILLRKESTWLASFSESATAFYDGLGNAVSNIVAQFGADGATIGRLGLNRIELTEDGLTQYTDEGVIGIMAGLSATNHTVDVTHTLARRMTGDVYWYKRYNSDSYRSNSITAEYPFTSDSPSTIDKFILHLSLYGAIGAKYDIAVPFASDFTYQVPDTTFYVRWTASTQTLSVRKETPDQQNAQGGGYTTLVVTYTSYITVENVRSPVLLFGEHSDMGVPGLYAVALGQNSTSDGDNASTLGVGTNASHDAQTAIGKYNANSSAHAFEVGNGTSDSARSNAFAVGWDGSVSTALDMETTTVADVLTASTGTTVAEVHYVQRGSVAALFVKASRSASISAGTATTIGTLASGKRPYMETAAPAPQGAGDVYVASDGTLTYRPSGAVSANANLYIRITYLVA